MRVETLSYIMALAVEVTTAIQIILMLPCRRSLRFTAIVMSAYAAAYYAILHFTGSMLISGSGLRGLVWLPPVLLLFKGLIFQRVFAFFLQYLLAFLQYSFTDAVAGIFMRRGSSEFNLVFLIFTLLMFMVCTALMYVFGRGFFQKLFSYGSESEWALYSFGAAFSFSIPIVSRITPGSVWQSIMSLLFTFWSFAVLCFAIINTHEKAKQKYEIELARGIVSSGREHYQRMDEMYEKLRILRHNYKYHLTTIGELLAEDNKDDTVRYLNDVQTQFDKIEMPQFCPNTVINALLTGYAERCVKLGIEYEVEVILPEANPIPNYEMCIVLGNLLENAVEACNKLTGEKKIQLLLKRVSGELALRVRNTYDGRLNVVDGQIKSMKKDGGFGMKSVEAVVERYGGELFAEWTEDTFSAYVAVAL